MDYHRIKFELIYNKIHLSFFFFQLQMESELERFHKQNTGLELNIAELRLKLKATEKELYGERQTVNNFLHSVIFFFHQSNTLKCISPCSCSFKH